MALRKTEGAILCPNCKRLIDADEPTCPHCGMMRPGLFGFGHWLGWLFGGRTDLVAGVMIVCVALYGATLALDVKGIGFAGLLSLLSPSSEALYTFGMTGGLAWSSGHYWTVATATFLHGGLIHLGFNMLWLRNLGPTVMKEMGPSRFLVTFLLTGILGALIANMYSVWFLNEVPWPSIGASGGVFGLMGVLLAFGRRRGGAWGRQLQSQMAMWGLIAGGIGFVMPGVNNAAHVGGFASGIALGYLMPRFSGAKESAVVQLVAVALAALTLAGMIASIMLMYPVMF